MVKWNQLTDFENQSIENREIELHFSRFSFNEINILNYENNRLKIIADQFFIIQWQFKWNKHVKIQKQQVDRSWIVQTEADLSEINTLKCKINRLTMTIFNSCIQQQIFMNEYIRLTCYKHIRPYSWWLKCLVQFLAC